MPLDSKDKDKAEKAGKHQENEAYSAAHFSRDLLVSAAYSAAANPTSGFLQITDQLFGSKLQKGSQTFFAQMGVEAPQANATGGKWLAQTLGSAGVVVPLLLLHKPVKALLADKGASILSERTTLGFTIKESALTGFLQGSVLTPSADQHFFSERIKGGIGSSVVFAGMTATSYKINRFAEGGYAVKHGFNSILSNPIVTGVISGVPGGALSAQVEAIKQGRALPTSAELRESILGESLVGGVFGAKQLMAENRAVSPSINSQSRELLNNPEVRSLLRAPRSFNREAEIFDNFGETLRTATVPQRTGPWQNHFGWQKAPWQLGEITRYWNGKTDVSDFGSSIGQKSFDKEGRLVTASANIGNTHSYVYNASGELRAIITDPQQGWFKIRGGWAQGGLNPKNGRLELFLGQAETARVTDEGALLATQERAWTVPLTNRFQSVKSKTSSLNLSFSDSEKYLADRLTGIKSPHDDSGKGANGSDNNLTAVAAELVAFRDAAQEIGLQSGRSQIEAEANRSLLAGNHIEAASLLVAAKKLLQQPGVSSLQAVRAENGVLSLTAEGYRDGLHHRYLLDGTVISTGELTRTTTFANGSKIEESFHDDSQRTTLYDAQERIAKIKATTENGEFAQNVRYDASGAVVSVSYGIAGAKTTLVLEGNNWQTKVELPQQGQVPGGQYTIDHGPGKVILREDGAAFIESASKGRTLLYEDDGQLFVVSAKQDQLFKSGGRVFSSVTPGQAVRVLAANTEVESTRRSELMETSFASPVERSQFEQASEKFEKHADERGLDSQTKTVLFAEVNNVLAKNSGNALALLEDINQTLTSSTKPQGAHPKLEVVVEKDGENTRIYIGNKALEVSARGELKVADNLLMRFDGITDSKFKAELNKAIETKLSKGVTQLLQQKGIAIIGAESVAKAFPSIASQRPPGWPDGATINCLDALYNPVEQRIVVAQNHTQHRNNQTETARTASPSEALLRAVGQAVDSHLGKDKFSQSSQFQEAFKADTDALPKERRPEFYTVASEAENRANLFADLFAATQAKIEHAKSIKALYPRTAALVEGVASKIDRGQADELGAERPPHLVTASEQIKVSVPFDADGRLLSSPFTPSASLKRELSRAADGTISGAIEKGNDSTYTIRKEGKNWTSITKAKDGSETQVELGEGQLSIDKENRLVFMPADPARPKIVHIKPGEEQYHYPDKRVERRLANGRSDFIAADYNHELALLKNSAPRAFLGRDAENAGPMSPRIKSLTRFEKMLENYSKSPAPAASSEKQALVFLQLNRLLADGPSKLSLGERGQLAELLLAQTIEPTKIWQGRHPTCNVTTAQHRLMVHHPDKVIALVADMAQKGDYVRTDGKVVKGDSIINGLIPDSEAHNNLMRQASGDGPVLNDDGSRDWAGQIIQSTLVRSAWMDKEFYLVGTHIAPASTVSYVRTSKPGETGDKFKAVMIDPRSLAPIDPRRLDLERVFDSTKKLIGMVPKNQFLPLRSASGEWLTALSPGDTGYNADGRALVHRASPEEIGFGPTYLGENTLVSIDKDQVRPLLGPDMELPAQPLLNIDDIANAYRSVNDDPKTPPQIIGFGTTTGTARAVNTKAGLMEAVNDLADRSQLPGILLVQTRSQPFGHWNDFGYHVVSVYGGNQKNDSIYFANQWGTNANFMQQGISAQALMNAVRPPIRPPEIPQMLLPVPMINSHDWQQAVFNQKAAPESLKQKSLMQNLRERNSLVNFFFKSTPDKIGH